MQRQVAEPLQASESGFEQALSDIQELLSQVTHYSERVRKDAITGLQQLLLSRPDELARQACYNQLAGVHEDSRLCLLHIIHARCRTDCTLPARASCVTAAVMAVGTPSTCAAHMSTNTHAHIDLALMHQLMHVCMICHMKQMIGSLAKIKLYVRQANLILACRPVQYSASWQNASAIQTKQ